MQNEGTASGSALVFMQQDDPGVRAPRPSQSSPGHLAKGIRPLTIISIPHVGPLIDTVSQAALTEAMKSPARLCVGADTDEWFPPEPVATSKRARDTYERTAENLCAGCPVRRECLILALRDEAKQGVARSGIYGGTAPWQREALIRRQRRTQAVAA